MGLQQVLVMALQMLQPTLQTLRRTQLTLRAISSSTCSNPRSLRDSSQSSFIRLRHFCSPFFLKNTGPAWWMDKFFSVVGRGCVMLPTHHASNDWHEHST